MGNYAIIDDITIPASHLKSTQTSEMTLEFAGSKLISSKTTLVLSNHGYTYDDRQNTGGLFETMAWYNRIVEIYDDETDELIWEGRLKKIEIDDGKMESILTVNDYVQDIVDTVCVCNLSNVTAAEAIYAILTDEDYLDIPETRIIKTGFEIGESLQQSEKIDVIYTADNNTKCIAVLEILCRNTGSNVFQKENKIGYWVWEQYTGILGTPIVDDDMTPGSYNQYTDDEKIFNEFSIAYKNGTLVAYAPGSDTVSQNTYGKGKLFAVPENSNDSTLASAFNVLYVDSAAANHVITRLKAKYKDMKKICTFTGKKSLEYINLGDFLDLKFSPFTREPVRVINIKPNRAKREFEFTCEFVNYPEIVELDLTAPDPVELFSAVYFEGSIYLRWAKSTKSDLLQYKLYFSNSENYWGGEFGYGKFSPVVIPYEQLGEIDTDCVYQFTNAEKGKQYWFRVSAVDTSFNESSKSNVVSLEIPDMPQIVHYSFDGSAIDRTGNGNDGTETDIDYGVGKFGGCAVLNGTSSKIRRTLSPVTDLTGKSAEIIFKCPDVLPSANRYLINIYQDSSNRFVLYFDTSGRLRFSRVVAGISSTYTIYTNFYDTNWHYAAINWIDSTKEQFYIDGLAQAVHTATLELIDLTAPSLRIGDINSSLYFEGSIDTCVINRRNLTSEEITQHNIYGIPFENRFNLSGEPVTGFTLDSTNAGGGKGLDNWAAFDDAEFDDDVFSPTALYESPVIRRRDMFTRLVYRSMAGVGNIMIQQREYIDGVFGEWSDEVDTMLEHTLDLNNEEYFQYRVIFNSPNWTDTDKFILTEVQ